MACRPELMGTGGTGLCATCFLASKDECTLVIRTRWERHNAAPNTSLHYLILMGAAATLQFIKHSRCVNTGCLSGCFALSSLGSCRNRTDIRASCAKTPKCSIVKIFNTTLICFIAKSSFLRHRADGASLRLVTFMLPVFRNGSPPSVSAGNSYSCAKGFSKPSQMDTRPGSAWIISFHQLPGEETASTRAEALLTTIRNLPVLTGLLTQDIIR